MPGGRCNKRLQLAANRNDTSVTSPLSEGHDEGHHEGCDCDRTATHVASLCIHVYAPVHRGRGREERMYIYVWAMPGALADKARS